MKFWSNMTEKIPANLKDADVLMIGDSEAPNSPKHSTLLGFFTWFLKKIGLDIIPEGNTIIKKNGLLSDSGEKPILYVNKYSPSGSMYFTYDPENPRGAAVVIPILDGDNLKDCTGLSCKVGFWMNYVTDTLGIVITDLSLIQNALVVLAYKIGVTTIYCPLVIKSEQRATVKDVYRKSIEVNFIASMTWAAPIVNGSIGQALVSNDQPSTNTETIDPYTEEEHTYIILDENKDNITVLSSGVGGIVTLPTDLSADKTILFTIANDSVDITIGGIVYTSGQVISASFILNTTSWEVNLLNPVVISDITDITVDVATNTYIAGTSGSYDEATQRYTWTSFSGYIDMQLLAVGDLILVKNHANKSNIGVFRMISIADDIAIATKVAMGKDLKNVRVVLGTQSGLWENQYNGADTDSIDFIRSENLIKKLTNSNENYHFNGFTPVYTPPHFSGLGSMVRLNESTLVLAFRTNVDLKDSMQGKGIVQMMTYNTDTNTWSNPSTIYDDALGYDITAVSLCVTTDGRVVCFFRRYNLITPAVVDCGFIYSDDDCVTWSAYTPIAGLLTQNTYGKGIKSGSLYIKPIYLANKCELVSSVDGSTWAYYSTPYNFAVDQEDGALNEPFIERIGDNKILLVTRSSLGRFWAYLSTDNGLTFTFLCKLPIPSFTMNNAVSPEIILDDDRDMVIVLGAGRSGNAYNTEKLIVYAAPVNDISNFAVINEVDRPNPNLVNFAGYTSTVKLAVGKYLTIVNDYSSPDTIAISSTSNRITGMWAATIIYSDYNSFTTSVDGDEGFLFKNKKTKNFELKKLLPAFVYDPINKLISPINLGSLILGSNAAISYRFKWFSNKAAVVFGKSTNGNSFSDTNVGMYAFGFGDNPTPSGEGSFAGGLNAVASGKNAIALGGDCSATADNAMAMGNTCVASAVNTLAMGRNASATHAASWVLRAGTTVNGANPALASSAINELSMFFINGLRFFTDIPNNLGIFFNPSGRLGINSLKTVVNGSTSGTAEYTMPFNGTGYKKVVVYCAALVGTASYTFPTAFSHVPVILTTSGLAASVVTTLTTTTITITGDTSTGYIIIEGN